MTLTVKAAETADGGLRDAVATLIPQLSSSSPPPDLDKLGRIIADPATTLLLAHQDDLLVGMLTLAVFQTPTGVRPWIEDVVVDDAALVPAWPLRWSRSHSIWPERGEPARST